MVKQLDSLTKTLISFMDNSMNQELPFKIMVLVVKLISHILQKHLLVMKNQRRNRTVITNPSIEQCYELQMIKILRSLI